MLQVYFTPGVPTISRRMVFERFILQPSINGAVIAPGAHSVHGQNPSITTWAYQKDAEQEKIRAQLTWQGIDHKLRLIGAAPLQELG